LLGVLVNILYESRLYLFDWRKKATESDLSESVELVTKDFPVSDKTFVGVCRGGEQVAVFDALLGYPSPEAFWIGLLIIHGELHNQGIGSSILSAIISAAGDARNQPGRIARAGDPNAVWCYCSASLRRHNGIPLTRTPLWHPRP
jgi:hypothetical protein